jgi:hypothetical protein
MILHSGRHNFWWLNVGVLGVTFIGLIFFFPETMWHRVHPNELVAQHKTGSTSPSDEKVGVTWS